MSNSLTNCRHCSPNSEKRVEGSAKIRAKYPDRVACIVEAARKDDPILEQRKFLVPSDSTVAKFIFQIRKQMKLDDHENVFVFVGENQQQPIGTALMSDVYLHNKYVIPGPVPRSSHLIAILTLHPPIYVE